MQTSDGTPMTRRQYLELVREQEQATLARSARLTRLTVVPSPDRSAPRRRALLHAVPSPRQG